MEVKINQHGVTQPIARLQLTPALGAYDVEVFINGVEFQPVEPAALPGFRMDNPPKLSDEELAEQVKKVKEHLLNRQKVKAYIKSEQVPNPNKTYGLIGEWDAKVGEPILNNRRSEDEYEVEQDVRPLDYDAPMVWRAVPNFVYRKKVDGVVEYLDDWGVWYEKAWDGGF